MSTLALVELTIRSRRRRLLALAAFAALFLAAGTTAAVLGRDAGGHVDFDALFMVGGYPLASSLLLLGWLLGRFPLIATVVLMAGIVSRDRREGYARLYTVRPVSRLGLYATRFAVLAGLAFAVSAVLMPTFDLIMLGTWAGPGTFVLIAAYVIVYGALTTLLSVWLRGDAWIAVLLGVFALVWDALRQGGRLPFAPGIRDFVSFVLPPQPAFYDLEAAFGSLEPIPWDAFAFAAGYGAVLLVLAGLSLLRREV